MYLWHCDRDGNYSMYSEAAADENHLRGVREAGEDGSLEFTGIFPAAYQVALPEDVCDSDDGVLFESSA